MEVVSFLGVAGEGIDKRECSVKKRLDIQCLPSKSQSIVKSLATTADLVINYAQIAWGDCSMPPRIRSGSG